MNYNIDLLPNVVTLINEGNYVVSWGNILGRMSADFKEQ